MKKQFAALILFLLTWLSGAAETIEQMLEQPKPIQPTRQEYLISRHAISLLLAYHYASHPITPAVSASWFKEYFRTLDPVHLFFQKGDIENFRSYETVLWDRTRNMANLEFAFKVYALYLQRIREYALYALEELSRPQDFTVEESIQFDRKDAEYPATPEEQRDLWRKRVKNELLQALMDKEKRAAKIESGELEPEPSPKTPEQEKEERRRNYARFYRRRTEVSPVEVLEFFLNSLTHTFDPHSNYMAPDTKANFDIDMSLSLQGIGATLTSMDSYVTIVSLVPGGPADQDGTLKPNDKIIAVAQDGQEAIDVVEMPLNRVVRQIRGPKGTKVTLTILKEGSRTPIEVTLVRDQIKLTDKEAKSTTYAIDVPQPDTKANVLVVHLASFYSDFDGLRAGDKDYKSTTRDIRNLLEKAKQSGNPVHGIILDLRGNGGDSLEEAINLTGLFFTSGPVVQVRNGRGRLENRVDPDPGVQFTGPLIVLMDRFSASASEITAAALQDCGRALVIGERLSHGKGTVQTIVDLNRFGRRMTAPGQSPIEFGSLKVTMGKFYRINGGATQLRGVTPDIIYPSLTDHMKDLGEDSLPNALPWDQIQPMQYTRYEQVAKLLPTLRQASLERIAANPDFQNYQRDMGFYDTFVNIKDIPLEINARRKFESDQEHAEEIFRAFRRRNTNYDQEREDRRDEKKGRKKKEEKLHDLVLEESLRVMGDYIQRASQTAQ
ncbi:MAG: carboxy terminal-processing peptidase [Victivallales bacterium]|nr:carboxy terminal-processing peptidase [Victivallales bacterium]